MRAWINGIARRAALRDSSRRELLEDAVPAPSLDRAERLTALAAKAAGSGGFTRRQGMKGLAAGALVAGPLGAGLSERARGASCVRVDPDCVRGAEAQFAAAAERCGSPSRRAGDLWAKIRCRLRAELALSDARAGCRRPDDSLCVSGQRCDPASGRCRPGGGGGQNPCAGDMPTEDSLRAAREAVAAGATEVPLSPGGCVTYRRTFQGGLMTSEVLTFGELTVLRATHTESGSSGRHDGDLDGFFESEEQLTFGTDPQAEVELRTLDPGTGKIVRRERRTLRDTTVHVVIEEDRGSGLAVVAEYDTPKDQEARSRSAGDGPGILAAVPCDNARALRYGNMLIKCVHQASECLASLGRGDLGRVLYEVGVRTVLLCDSDLGDDVFAQAVDSHEAPLPRNPRILVNPTNLDREPPQQQQSTICHELMHYSGMPGHRGSIGGSDHRNNVDQVYACEELCGFGATPSTAATKCECATCLQTTTCDERCRRFVGCPNDQSAAFCPCPDCPTPFYPDETTCLGGGAGRSPCSTCGSGLSCFGFSTCTKLPWPCPPQ